MIVHYVEQGSAAWHDLRLGIPTASRFSEILTNKKMDLSAQAAGYIYELIAEVMIGEPCDTRQSEWMQRGSGEMEEQACRWYEMMSDCDTLEVGFVSDDLHRYGCSPDRLIQERGAVHPAPIIGGLEIKCPGAKKHLEYLLNPQALVQEYRHQVQGSLWVCREHVQWWDILSYHPTLPKRPVRVYPDPEWRENFERAFAQFLMNKDEIERLAREIGCVPWKESDAYRMLRAAQAKQDELQQAAPMRDPSA